MYYNLVDSIASRGDEASKHTRAHASTSTSTSTGRPSPSFVCFEHLNDAALLYSCYTYNIIYYII